MKLAIDAAVMMMGSQVDEDNLVDDLEEFDRKWHLGPEDQPAWSDAIRRGVSR